MPDFCPTCGASWDCECPKPAPTTLSELRHRVARDLAEGHAGLRYVPENGPLPSDEMKLRVMIQPYEDRLMQRLILSNPALMDHITKIAIDRVLAKLKEPA